MIAAANPHAARAGLEMLRAGGGAVDAAIAAQAVLSLVEPQSSGIGGGAFLMHYAAGTQGASGETRVEAYDGRETAPAGANAGLFLGPDGKPLKFLDAVIGGRAVGVPGVPRMLALAHADHGVLPWKRLFAPAIRLAEAGFRISPRLHRFIGIAKGLKKYRPARAYFYTPKGEPKAVGTVLVNPAYAETLRRIAADGADAFYGKSRATSAGRFVARPTIPAPSASMIWATIARANAKRCAGPIAAGGFAPCRRRPRAVSRHCRSSACWNGSTWRRWRPVRSRRCI